MSLILIYVKAKSFYIEYQQTLTGPHSSIPQIAEPANVEQSKNIDLDPYASSTRPVSAEPSVQEGSMAKLDAKLPADGMSATSGPLSDDLSGIYGSPLASPMDSKQQELPKWEGLCPVEKEGSVAEAREGDQDVEAATERDAITQRQDMDKGIPTEPATEGVSPADVQDMEEAVSGEPAD